MPQKIYTLLLRLLAPLIWVYMLVRARRAGGQWQIFSAERFGAYALPWDGEAPVWVHAVSLGETRAAQSLMAQLLARGERVLLTHMTATGRAEGARLFANEIANGQLRQQWVPYDFPGATRKFMQHYQPRIGILIEREVWPNLIEQAQLAGVPIILASARFSEKSQKQVEQIDKVFLSLMRETYAGLDLTLAQTEDDARRLYEVGALNIHVVGNLKFDVALPAVAVDAGRAWRQRLNRPVIAIASTRENEDALFVKAMAQQQTSALFLLIPRHPQRFDEAASLLEQAGIATVRWSLLRQNSQAEATLAEIKVVLCDTLGEMPLFYAASDVAIVAGSFAPHGGQNLIEACALGTPVIVGPYTYNFAEAVEQAVAIGAAAQIQSTESLDAAQRAVSMAIMWLNDQQGLTEKRELAREWVAQHTGATNRILQHITEFEAARAQSLPPQH
ncbi:MAG: 3-deoxy-D-manno-octulosonic acid transferase [Alcaligenaceae bacterium]